MTTQGERILGPALRGEGETCPDCGVEPGTRHLENCDVARCTVCGGQFLQCGQWDDEGEYDPTAPWQHVWPDVWGLTDPQPQIWDGTWPGTKEATALSLWCRWGPPWIECSAATPGAMPDLNRLAEMCVKGELRWTGSEWVART